MRLIEAPVRLFNAQGLHWLALVELDDQARLLIDTDLQQLQFLERRLEALDNELARQGHDTPAVKLLMTLPGVDVATAQSLLAAWGDWRRFPDAAHAASYLGLVPSTRQSAHQCYHGPITKRGNSQARWMLIEAAQHLDRHFGPLGHFVRRLMRKKNRNVAVVAAARKLAMIAWHMLTHDEPYRYAIPRTTETKLARLRVKATGERRKTGPTKGKKCKALQPGTPGGSRTIKSLAGVCRAEGLPAPQPLSRGERRTVQAAGCAAQVAEIATEQVAPRRGASKPNTAAPTRPAVARLAASDSHSKTERLDLSPSCCKRGTKVERDRRPSVARNGTTRRPVQTQQTSASKRRGTAARPDQSRARNKKAARRG